MRFAPAFLVGGLLFAARASGAASAAGDATSLQPDAATTAELKSLRTQLLDALQSGDQAALERLLADGFVFVHSTGVMERRDAFIARTVAMSGKSPPSRNEFLDDDIRFRHGLFGVTDFNDCMAANILHPCFGQNRFW